jgi:hypothetical protein
MNTVDPLDPLSDDEFSHLVQRAVRELPDVPPALTRSVLALWPSAGAQLTSAAQALAAAVVRRIRAELSFDSWAGPAAAHGMRSLRAPTRHLLFSAQGRDIDLRIVPTAPAFTLAGQILGPDETGRVELRLLAEPEATPQAVELDEVGEFRIEGVATGDYALTLHLNGDLIELSPLQVGEYCE